MKVLSEKDKLNTKNAIKVILKYTQPTKRRDINDMQSNKTKFSRNVAHAEFPSSAFRIQKLPLAIFRNSK